MCLPQFDNLINSFYSLFSSHWNKIEIFKIQIENNMVLISLQRQIAYCCLLSGLRRAILLKNCNNSIVISLFKSFDKVPSRVS